MRAAAIAGFSVGALGIGVGTVFGVLSMSKHNQAKSDCSTPNCPTAAGQSEWSDAYTFGNVATAAFIVGGVGLAAGVTFWLVAPKPAESAAARLVVAPGAVTVKGEW
jgi:hypothetical protein